MRTILFRGKRVDNGEWIEGYLIKEDAGAFIFNDGQYGKRFSVDPKTVGQYTGLKDKNKTRIFEGDKLSNKGIATGVVKFGEYILKNQTKHDRQRNHLGWYIEEGFNKYSLEDLFYNLQGDCSIQKREDQQWIEMIGNLHDSKPLAKQS